MDMAVINRSMLEMWTWPSLIGRMAVINRSNAGHVDMAVINRSNGRN